jgi:hypothetical protein
VRPIADVEFHGGIDLVVGGLAFVAFHQHDAGALFDQHERAREDS